VSDTGRRVTVNSLTITFILSPIPLIAGIWTSPERPAAVGMSLRRRVHCPFAGQVRVYIRLDAHAILN
jgi:hypothetical protein